MSEQNVSSRLPGDDREGGGDVGHRPSPAAPTPKPHSLLDEVAAELEYLMSAAERPGTISHGDAADAEARLLAHVRGLEEQLEITDKQRLKWERLAMDRGFALEGTQEQLEAYRAALDMIANDSYPGVPNYAAQIVARNALAATPYPAESHD